MSQTPETAPGQGAVNGLAGVDPQNAGGSEKVIPFPDPRQGGSSAFVSLPRVGAYRTEDHRYYFNGKGPVPSVTSILKVLDKPAIVQWAKRTVAEIAVDKWEELGAMINGSGKGTSLIGEPNSRDRKDQAVKWLASLPDYQRDEAGRLGTGIHLLADMAARASESDSDGFQVSEQEKPYLEAFRTFLGHLRASGGEIVSSEKMVWSSVGYAGTYDLLVRWQDQLWMVDIKTSKGYYPEYALQMVAYAYADSIILEADPSPYPMPPIQRYAVLHLRPELYPETGFRFVEYIGVGDKDYIAFLGALELYRWKEEGRYTKKVLSSGIQNLKPPSDTGNPLA